ncbi:MAG: beta-ketoacyl-[acyl-carrier-protein] synthase family protein [Comamonas sp.]
MTFVHHITATSALGSGLSAQLQALRAGQSGLKRCDFESVTLDTWIGEVAGLDAIALPAALKAYDCRNHRLALMGLQADGFEQAARAAINRYGAQRVALIVGTSTSGILLAEQAYRERHGEGALPDWFDYHKTHNTGALAAFVREYLGVQGPAYTLSTACSSSAKAFAAADRLLQLGLVDAAVVGGVDSLCLTTLYGFASLELTSHQACRPCDVDRDGLSIGEAAAFALLTRDAQGASGPALAKLAGWGEASDAHHMSAPHPEGRGSRSAMTAALAMAGLAPSAVDYVNLHGTATPANDASEGGGVRGLLGGAVPCSSTKGLTGHTLGAAGALEAVISVLCIQHGLVPGSVGTHTVDPAIGLNVPLRSYEQPLAHVLSNSFGFGGSNCSLLFSQLEGAQ